MGESTSEGVADTRAEAWLVVGEGGVIESASPAALSFLYVDPIDAIGRTLSSFVVPEERAALASALLRAKVAGTASIPMRMRPKGRSPRSRRLSLRAVPEGRLRVVLGERQASGRVRVVGRAPTIRRPAPTPSTGRRLTQMVTSDLARSIDTIVGWIDLLSRDEMPRSVARRGLEAIERQARRQRAMLDELERQMEALLEPEARARPVVTEESGTFQVRELRVEHEGPPATAVLERSLSQWLTPAVARDRARRVTALLGCPACRLSPRDAIELALAQGDEGLGAPLSGQLLEEAVLAWEAASLGRS